FEQRHSDGICEGERPMPYFQLRRSSNQRQRVHKPGRESRWRKLGFEALESRILPSQVQWINPNGGNWGTAANWSTGSVPGSGDDAVINTAAAATITIQAGDVELVNSLMTAANDALSLTGGALTVNASSTLSGPLAMTGGSLTVAANASLAGRVRIP